MPFYSFPTLTIPNAPEEGATPEEIQEWRQQLSGYLRRANTALEELGEAYIGNGVQLADLVVDTAHINSAAITTAKIADAQITSAKIIDAQITEAKIVDLAVTTAKINDLDVTGEKLADGTVTGGKIAANTITANNIAVGTITAAEIESGTITGDLIDADTVTVTNLTVANFDNVVENPGFEIGSAGATTITGWTNATSFALVTDTPHTGSLAARYTGTAAAATITTVAAIPVVGGQEWYAECHILPGSANTTASAQVLLVWLDENKVFSSQSAGNQIGSAGASYAISSIAATAPTAASYVLVRGRVVTAPSSGGLIQFDDFYARRKVGGAYIEDASITTAHIQDAQITTALIADAQISTAKIIDAQITGAKIANATITTANIGNLQVTGDLIANATITAAKIVANTITAAEIAGGTITGAEIDAGTISATNLIIGNFDNIVENPGFEESTASGATTTPGWTHGANWNFNAFSARSGNYHAAYSGAVDAAVITNDNQITVAPGDEWYAECYVRCNNTNTIGAGQIVLVWLDTAASFLSQNVGNAVSDADTGYHLSAAAATAPTGAAYLLVRGRVFTAPSAGNNIKFDDFYCRRKLGGAYIEDAAIGTAQIVDAAITTAKIAAAQITTALIADAQITTAKIGAAQITTAKIANAQITEALIVDGAVTADKIAANTITANEIAAGTLTTTEIQAGTIIGGDIAAGTITGANIAADTLSTSNLIVGNFDNVVENPGFEISPVWMSWDLGTGFITSAALQRSGNFCAAYTATADGGIITMATPIPVVPGEEWYAEVWTRRAATATEGAGQVLLVWLDTAAAFLSQDAGNQAAAASYTLSSIAAAAPAGAAYLLIRGRAPLGPSSGGFVRFDDFYSRKKLGGAYIEDAAIDTAHIIDLAVSSAKIDSAAVGTAKIADAAITTAKIGALQVTGPLIADGTITGTKVDADTITVSNLIVSNLDNVVENGSFELDTAGASTVVPGWTPVEGSNWAKNTNSPRSGVAVMRNTESTVATLRNLNRVAVTEGEEWYAECWVLPRSLNTTGAAAIQLVYRDDSLTVVGSVTGNQIGSAGASYARSSVTGTIPAGASFLDIRLRVVTPPSAGGWLDFDDVYARRQLGTAFIEDAAIVTAKIGDLAVSTAKIDAAAVTTAKIADANITTAKIANAQITNALMANAAIDSAQIVNGAIDTAHIGDAQITTAKIGNGQITTAKIGNLQVDTAQIANLAVETLQIGNDQVTSDKRQDVSSFSQRHSAVSALSSQANQKTHSLGKVPSMAISRTTYNSVRVLPMIDDADTSVFWMYSTNIASSGGDLDITWVAYYW